jgi:RND family efflux transporter MFP subunit
MPRFISPFRHQFHRCGGALLLSLALLLVGCGDSTSKPSLEPSVRPVKLHTVQAQGNAPVREYSGTVSATERATLSFEAPGTVVEFPVENGQQVRKGQLLARIDTQDVQSRLAAAQAQENAAESAYERAKRLYAEGIVSLQQLETRRREYEVAQSEVTRAQEALTDTRLTAPFGGRVADTHVELNESVGPQAAVVTVQDLRRLEVVVDVPEQDQLRRAFEEAPLRVSLPMLEEQSFPATLREITTTAAPSTRTYEATLTFDPPRGAGVLPGMSARAMVGGRAAASPEAPLVVPTSAVFSAADGTPSVWVVDSTMTVTPRPVTLGTPRDSTVAVQSGLQDGERIAATGVQQLQEGQPVRSLMP